jgi:hypothetical protein
LLFKASGSIAVACEGIYLALTAEGEGCFGFAAAFRADIAGWENLGITVRADFTLQCVSLFFQTPVAWNFHV